MNPDEVEAWSGAVQSLSDALGPTFVAVIVLVVLAWYVMRKGKPENHDTSDIDVAVLKEQYRNLEARVSYLENLRRAMN